MCVHAHVCRWLQGELEGTMGLFMPDTNFCVPGLRSAVSAGPISNIHTHSQTHYSQQYPQVTKRVVSDLNILIYATTDKLFTHIVPH